MNKFEKLAAEAKIATSKFGESALDLGRRTKEIAARNADVVVSTVTEGMRTGSESISDTAEKVADGGLRGLNSIREVAQTGLDDIKRRTKTLPIDELANVEGNKALYFVLNSMIRSELEGLYSGPLGVGDHDKVVVASDDGLRHLVASELLSSGKNSLMIFENLPPYEGVVRLVAKRIGVGEGPNSDIAAVEKAILFKIVEKSIDKMSEEERSRLTQQVEQELLTRGIHRKITVSEIKDITKFIVMDFGGSVGGVVIGAPGFAGMIGLNLAQVIVLKGIIATSGYVSAGGALLGLGGGGAMLALAGAVGPISLVLGALYAGYTVAGPAFRKLVPSICVLAAKRIEFSEQSIAPVSIKPI